MKKKAYTVLIVVFTIILIINIFSILNLSFFGFRIYKIGSGSMEPYLKVNDYIIVKRKKNYNVGNVVTYKKSNEYITHRIKSIDGDTVITQGDSNNIEDQPINKKDIIGGLVYKSHGLSIIFYSLNKPILWVLLFIVGLFITILIPDKRKERS